MPARRSALTGLSLPFLFFFAELPDNLKQLFRSMAMTQADKVLIGQVILYLNGFLSAESLSSKVSLLFGLCEAQLSSQSHYDFGLRSLKAVLRIAGNLSCDEISWPSCDSCQTVAVIRFPPSDRRARRFLARSGPGLHPARVDHDQPSVSRIGLRCAGNANSAATSRSLSEGGDDCRERVERDERPAAGRGQWS